LKQQKELDDRIVPCQRGKVLGGCSAINQMKIVYPSKPAFDAWEKMGNPGWNWDCILPYLQRFHTHHANDEAAQTLAAIAVEAEPFKSRSGHIQTSYSGIGPLEKAWYASWNQIMTELNYEGTNFGGFLAAASIDPNTKTRSYAATGCYSAEIANRPNVRIVTGDEVVAALKSRVERKICMAYISLWHLYRN
jgi:choline dehydrogenase-like flavoprotein